MDPAGDASFTKPDGPCRGRQLYYLKLALFQHFLHATPFARNNFSNYLKLTLFQHFLHATPFTRNNFSKHVKCRLLYTFRDEDLRDLGMVHDRVNHTYNFVDAVTGVHTNHIEGTWYALKHTATPIRHRSPNFVVGDICTLMGQRCACRAKHAPRAELGASRRRRACYY